MNPQLLQRILSCSTLPSLPTVAVEVLKLAKDEDGVNLSAIARVIANDPALSSKILRTVNSSFYAAPNPISTVDRALVILGLRSVKTLVLGFSLIGSMGGKRTRSFDHLTYWRHSLFAATAARTLSERVSPKDQEDCFVAGLLMDIGMLVLDQVLGEEYGRVTAMAQGQHQELCDIEARELGLHHAQIAGVLAQQWNLPPVLRVPMAWHHQPQEVEDQYLKSISSLISMGSRCADVFVDQAPASAIVEVRKLCMERYNIDELSCDSMLCKIGQRTHELAPLFEFPIDSGLRYENILEKANESLLSMTLSALEHANEPDKRQCMRVRRSEVVMVMPCASGLIGQPVESRLRDVSARGLGLACPQKLALGSQFIVQLPQKKGKPVSILYSVKRCESLPDDQYDIGAELTCILNQEPVFTESATHGALEKIHRAVLSNPAA